jgi:molecular chaperone GrpE
MVEEIKNSRERGGKRKDEQQAGFAAGEQLSEEEQGLAETAPEQEPEALDADIETLYQEIEFLKQQVAENLDKALRSQAEMENLRKRTAREIENAHKFGLDRFIRELLPVIDSLELGISASDNAEDIAGLREGMDLTLKKFRDVLSKSGIEVIDPQGEKFNPELHEAVSVTAAEGGQSGSVIAVMQKGYTLNGRLVRPAMVVVAQ